MADSKLSGRCKWDQLSTDDVDLIIQCLDISSTVRLAACCKLLYDRIANNKGTKWTVHHYNEPCLLMPQPAYWFDEHYDSRRVHRLHDTVYDVVPLDHPRCTTILPFINEKFWVGMNGDWLAAVDQCGAWCLANIYTYRVVDLLSMDTCDIAAASHPQYNRYGEKFNKSWDGSLELLKIVICRVPVEAGGYTDYKLLALFNSEIAYLEGGSQVWRYLEHSGLGRRQYYDATEHGGLIFAITSQGYTYCWDPTSEGNKELPFVIPAPILNDRLGMWFLARSTDGECLMIIITTYGMGVAHGEEGEIIHHAQNRTNLHLYLASRVYIFEDDPSSAGPPGVIVWRQVNNLGDNSLFLGLNYPIIDKMMKKRGCKAADGTLFPFMRKNCVYTTYRRFRGIQFPQIKCYNLQPTEGEPVAVISLPKDGWNFV